MSTYDKSIYKSALGVSSLGFLVGLFYPVWMLITGGALIVLLLFIGVIRLVEG